MDFCICGFFAVHFKKEQKKKNHFADGCGLS